jgi:hypothetical protein
MKVDRGAFDHESSGSRPSIGPVRVLTASTRISGLVVPYRPDIARLRDGARRAGRNRDGQMMDERWLTTVL